MNNTFILRAEKLNKVYDDAGDSVQVLNNVSLTLAPQQAIAIIGASGSGKSTLLQLLGGLDQPTSGEVYVNEKLLRTLSESQRCHVRNTELGFVYQFHHLLSEFTALENVAMPLLIRGESFAQAQQQAREILNEVGLSLRLHHKPGELSGGERQRTAIARALVTHPACVLADEPTGNLDRRTAEKIYTLMAELRQKFKTSFIVVTHDLAYANTMDKILTLEAGQLISTG